MASSSRNVPPQIKHDVFINFRGKDTRKKFFSHLRDALKRNAIDAFTDKRLKGGEAINDTLMRKISESQASVVIFSPNYADSRWCLDELVRIVHCERNLGHKVLPVFLDVEPTHVRNQTGAFGDGFAKLEKKEKNAKRVRIWRRALRKVASLSGWDSSQITEAKILEKVVNQIQTILGKMTPTDIDKSFVGIKHRLKEVESYLFSDRVKSLGIWGCPGIGKTALAKKLFEKHYTNFEGAWIIHNVGEKQGHELEQSWKEMLSRLLGEDKTSQPPYVFSRDIQWKLKRKRVLIVLDDVEDCQQFKNLVWGCTIYGPGSKIIVTSKNKQVLSILCDETYEVQKLSDDEAIRLLKSNILKKRQATPEHMELMKQAISYAEGLPLALIILGRNLCDKDIKYWRSELAKLCDIPDQDVTKILRTSYDELEHTQKKIFLDIACFFHRWDRTRVEAVLDACNFHADTGIERLLDKALITVSGWNTIQMHNLLRQMGRHIVTHDSEDPEDPTTMSRLWRWNDVYDILTNDSGTRKIEILSMTLREKKDLTLRRTALAKMSKLRVLSFSFRSADSRIHLPEGLEYLPNSIRCLIWNRYPLANFPQEFQPEFLVELQLRGSSIKELWSSGMEPRLGNLKHMDLEFSSELIRLPELLGCPNLVTLNLCFCSSLEQIPTSLQHLHKLERLELGGCRSVTNLSELPESLLHLSLLGSGIEKLPSSIQSLQNLEMLKLERCKRLDSLPSSFFQLKFSKELSLGWLIETYRPYLKSPLGLCVHCKVGWNFATCINRKVDLSKKWNSAKTQYTELSFAHSNVLQAEDLFNESQYLFIPGSEVPQWFKYSETGSALTINSRLHSSRLAFCAVLALKGYEPKRLTCVNCDWVTSCGETFRSWFWSPLFADSTLTNEKQHILVWCDPKVRSYKCTKAVFNFSVVGDDCDWFEIIKCGVTSLKKRM